MPLLQIFCYFFAVQFTGTMVARLAPNTFDWCDVQAVG